MLSGAYSSIFIATPVLTHWKEREPAYRARRGRLIEEMGHVPTFPEENVVAKVGADGEPAPPAPGARRAADAEPRAAEPQPGAEPVAPAPRRRRRRPDGADEPPEAEPSRWVTAARPADPPATLGAPAQAPPAAPPPKAREASLMEHG